mmetsp:Transcript_19874/g.64673  ORF Transcript_19874/g.64673 Transcript_19874/m.64673 type:complete len:304 (-) Transcript_19874:85-996(-)|eukprot:CAMPEP_0170145128 /NCGR_PEP_ID=MMETSP0033_2-20121228/16350_1 /TAXON_ID=195969 /ORGANISM="Dolichomastix tenuilepis, Strain CCMP3274" /LENGTH=303 /DNA_ID=CAMNT_0010381665 /DNA_START=53 /DNA_END=964 /DNA_ORIENTATION=+
MTGDERRWASSDPKLFLDLVRKRYGVWGETRETRAREVSGSQAEMRPTPASPQPRLRSPSPTQRVARARPQSGPAAYQRRLLQQQRLLEEERAQRRATAAPADDDGAPEPGVSYDADGAEVPIGREGARSAGLYANDGPNSQTYSVKYFGVAHGQLGVLSRRKPLMQSANRSYGMPRPSTAPSKMRLHVRTGDAAGAARPLTVEGVWVKDEANERPDTAGSTSPRLSARPQQRDGLLELVEDTAGSTWLPTQAMYGRTLRVIRRAPQKSSRPSNTLPKPAPFISHNALAGWKLTSLARKGSGS